MTADCPLCNGTDVLVKIINGSFWLHPHRRETFMRDDDGRGTHLVAVDCPLSNRQLHVVREIKRTK